MPNIENLRILLIGNKNDDTQDELILLLSDITTQRLKLIIEAVKRKYKQEVAKPTIIPAELEWIVTEVTAKRFNRVGSEGMKSEGVEGRSATYSDDDFAEYMLFIDGYFEPVAEEDAQGWIKGDIVGYP